MYLGFDNFTSLCFLSICKKQELGAVYARTTAGNSNQQIPNKGKALSGKIGG